MRSHERLPFIPTFVARASRPVELTLLNGHCTVATARGRRARVTYSVCRQRGLTLRFVCPPAVGVQNTFCTPGFELFVTGRSGRAAVDDNRRLCASVYCAITQIVASLDTLRRRRDARGPLDGPDRGGQGPLGADAGGAADASLLTRRATRLNAGGGARGLRARRSRGRAPLTEVVPPIDGQQREPAAP
jgi:hypothetical protein